MEEGDKVTPMMAQWQECKESVSDAVLLFRMGDFYEAFHEDAEIIAKELELTLTRRQGIPMAGVPWHAADGYIDRLVAKGYRVAIAEQTEDPSKTKKLVNREVVRVVTPGTVINSSRLSDKSNNYIISLHQIGSMLGLAVIDLTTSEFRVTESDAAKDVCDELFRLRPAELLIADKLQWRYPDWIRELDRTYHPLITTKESWYFDQEAAYNLLQAQFRVHSLDGFGLKGMTAGVSAAGALVAYLQQELSINLSALRPPQPVELGSCVSIDRATMRNLELTHSLHQGGSRHTLLEVLDQTETPMGGRLLRHWIQHPLVSPGDIALRQDEVQAFLNHPLEATAVRESLSQIRDLERLVMKICSGLATPRELVQLRLSLEQFPAIREALSQIDHPAIALEKEQLGDFTSVAQEIATALVDDPPLRLGEGGFIRMGYSKELDELRSLSRDGKSWIARYQAKLRDSTGIKNLKVGFNRVFGYYLEVSKGQTGRMPDHFQRRQTLVNTERYISPELKEYEQKIFSAEERMAALEQSLFAELRLAVAEVGPAIAEAARHLARLDCLASFAHTAREMNYVRPVVDDSMQLQIIKGRHPVVEWAHPGERFVPNDTQLDGERQKLILLTGPNMAGKSTYIRQVALIVIMAQIGSYVPADRAHIGCVDRVFTRIGASDDLTRGQSTFMVEMTETANILNNATNRSLVILDEIGRGTSTYDGVSIAWAVAEHLLTSVGCQPKTLFATHYWELTQLADQFPEVMNCNVAVKEDGGMVHFLHQIVPGSADKSYGIHVARLAGLPMGVVARAQKILDRLESTTPQPNKGKRRAPKKSLADRVQEASTTTGPTPYTRSGVQLTLFE